MHQTSIEITANVKSLILPHKLSPGTEMQQVQCHAQIKTINHSQSNVTPNTSCWPTVRELFHSTTAALSHHRSLSLCSSLILPGVMPVPS